MTVNGRNRRGKVIDQAPAGHRRPAASLPNACGDGSSLGSRLHLDWAEKGFLMRAGAMDAAVAGRRPFDPSSTAEPAARQRSTTKRKCHTR